MPVREKRVWGEQTPPNAVPQAPAQQLPSAVITRFEVASSTPKVNTAPETNRSSEYAGKTVPRPA